jgi:hypothetical protein
VTDPRPRPAFAHASEAELARILDFYDVRWEYEPHVFPIRFDRAGNVLESFAPDFWLPDLELYVELTTLKQRLVRKKNRKLRRLLELYPEARVKLLYAKDFRALMLKYGKLALVDALSGAEGQTTPPRTRSGTGGQRPEGPTAPSRAIPAAATPAGTADASPSAPSPPRVTAAAAAPPDAPPILTPRPQRPLRRGRRTRAEARARAAARALARGEPPEADR